MVKIAIIGGSGLEKSSLIQSVSTKETETKWGTPSSPITEGILNGVPGYTFFQSAFPFKIKIHNHNYRKIKEITEVN